MPTSTIRCSKCCQLGHNRRYCKQNDSDASVMTASYNESLRCVKRYNRQKIQHEAYELRSRRYREIERESYRTPDIIETQDINGNIVFAPREIFLTPYEHKNISTRPRSLIKIQEILFDNSQDLSDGLYKQLMDALIIKD